MSSTSTPAGTNSEPSTRLTPESLQIRWRGFVPALLAAVILVGLGLAALGYWGGVSGLWCSILLGTTLGLTLTVAGMSWAGTIALAEDPVRGMLFVLIPPYTLWRAVVRFDIFWQPMLVFLLGTIMAFGSVVLATQAIETSIGR